MYLSLPLLLAFSCLLSLTPPVAASLLPQDSRSIYVRHHDIYARSPYAKHYEEPPRRPGTPFPRETPGTPTRASVGTSRPVASHRGARQTYQLHCNHDQTEWNPFHNPAVGPGCEDFMGCHGVELRQRRGPPNRGMFNICARVCRCVPLDGHVVEMEQMERGMVGIRTQHSER